MVVTNAEQNDFTLFLPLTISEDIFINLDIHSICSASQVSRRWNDVIGGSEYIWRMLYMSSQANINEYYGNKISSSYKDLVAKTYKMQRSKTNWMNGQYSNVSSFDELDVLHTCSVFSKNDWGDIFQQELDR